MYFVLGSLLICYQAFALWQPPHEFIQIRDHVHTLLPKIILPEGKLDQQAYQELIHMRDAINQFPQARELKALYIQQLNFLIKNLPIASKILSYGYQPELYQRIAQEMRNKKNRFAQPLLDLRYNNFTKALDLMMGNPQEDGFDTPNPYDAAYEQIVDDYLIWSQKLDDLGPYASRKSLTHLADEFMVKFDQMLTRNAIGQERKAQLIKWLGGPEKYLGTILGRMIKQRGNQERRSVALDDIFEDLPELTL